MTDANWSDVPVEIQQAVEEVIDAATASEAGVGPDHGTGGQAMTDRLVLPPEPSEAARRSVPPGGQEE